MCKSLQGSSYSISGSDWSRKALWVINPNLMKFNCNRMLVFIDFEFECDCCDLVVHDFVRELDPFEKLYLQYRFDLYLNMSDVHLNHFAFSTTGKLIMWFSALHVRYASVCKYLSIEKSESEPCNFIVNSSSQGREVTESDMQVAREGQNKHFTTQKSFKLCTLHFSMYPYEFPISTRST